ncbi:MAG: hypothetical protein JW864_00445 [Spirochaetes bacterium]|nr:hypothetical protein [Spirochaetota bacterium]
MLYFLSGIIAGILISLSPVFLPDNSIEIHPEWYAHTEFSEPEISAGPAANIQTSANKTLSEITLQPVISLSAIHVLNGNGRLLKSVRIKDKLISVSGNGEYYIQYEKMGSSIELKNTNGDRFWCMKSREYPYISYNGKIILLMNGDHSKIRIVDRNGNQTGAGEIHGRLCTDISFSDTSDFSAVCFLGGNYYLLNEKGEIIDKGLNRNQINKGITISSNGIYYAVHYGNADEDFVKIADLLNKKSHILKLNKPHPVKAAMHVTNNGSVTVFDHDRLIIAHGDEIKRIIGIPPKRPGLSSIDFNSGIYSAGYTGSDDRVHFFIFQENSSILLHKIMTEESYINVDVRDNSIFLTGSHNLYCYSLRIPDNQ